MDAIILLGGPGAGKGTLAEALKGKTTYIHVSTGNILRAAVKSDSEIGREVKDRLSAGQFVSDALILEIVKTRISQEDPDAKFMFDGFPRTIEQAKSFQTYLAETGGTLSHVFNLSADLNDLMLRLCGRRTCKTCGAIFNVASMPPKEEGICDLDGGELFQRADDNEETVMKRLDIYKKQTAPLIDFYQDLGLIRSINASCSAEDVVHEALSALNA